MQKEGRNNGRSFGIELGIPVSMTESGEYAPSVYVRWDEYVADEKFFVSTPIQSGTIEVNASVNLAYEY